MFKEFKEFAMKGNIMDLAIGVIIGGAFQKIVTSLVNDIIMPCISIFTGKIDYSNLFITVGDSKIAYGSFLTAVVDFLVVAFSLFLIIRYINKLNKKLEQAKIQELSRLNKLGNQFLEKNKIFKKKNKTKKVIIPDSGLVLKPNVLYIGRTNEECYSDTFIPMLNGRSSIGRLGICVHVTAGFGDIGWKGTWTLEIIAFKPVRIYPNIEFCQVSYFTPFGQTYLQYDGRYQGQIEPTASKSSLEKKVYL